MVQPISERELEVLEQVSLGFSTKEIADKLYLSNHTVNDHRKSLLAKLGARNSAHLILISMNKNLI